jgi:hypothetical protein
MMNRRTSNEKKYNKKSTTPTYKNENPILMIKIIGCLF